jgi:hypothetical protein
LLGFYHVLKVVATSVAAITERLKSLLHALKRQKGASLHPFSRAKKY